MSLRTERYVRAQRELDEEEWKLGEAQLVRLAQIPVAEEVREELHALETEVTRAVADGEDARELLAAYQAAVGREVARMLALMQQLVEAYMLMRSRWGFVTALPSFASPGCHQVIPDRLGSRKSDRSTLRSIRRGAVAFTFRSTGRPPVPTDREQAVVAYFEVLPKQTIFQKSKAKPQKSKNDSVDYVCIQGALNSVHT